MVCRDIARPSLESIEDERQPETASPSASRGLGRSAEETASFRKRGSAFAPSIRILRPAVV